MEPVSAHIRKNFARPYKRWALVFAVCTAVHAAINAREQGWSALELAWMPLAAWAVLAAAAAIVISISLAVSYHLQRRGIVLPVWLTRERG